jgi:hypothetical protein
MESYWAVAVSLGLRTVPGWRSAGLSNKALLSRCVLERGKLPMKAQNSTGFFGPALFWTLAPCCVLYWPRFRFSAYQAQYVLE